jgi:hypothetical protein
MLFIIVSCKPIKDSTNEALKTESLIEDFNTFYNRFHADSLFQMSRIKFPLQGLRVDGSEETQWSKNNWGLLTTKIYDVDTTEYRVSYKRTINDFTEKVWIENSGFWSEYKFKLIDNKWYLVSAIEQNL